MFDKRYQVKRTFFTVKHFPNSVDAAMPNKDNNMTTNINTFERRYLIYLRN
jgi:hypothetical protein